MHARKRLSLVFPITPVIIPLAREHHRLFRGLPPAWTRLIIAGFLAVFQRQKAKNKAFSKRYLKQLRLVQPAQGVVFRSDQVLQPRVTEG